MGPEVTGSRRGDSSPHIDDMRVSGRDIADMGTRPGATGSRRAASSHPPVVDVGRGGDRGSRRVASEEVFQPVGNSSTAPVASEEVSQPVDDRDTVVSDERAAPSSHIDDGVGDVANSSREAEPGVDLSTLDFDEIDELHDDDIEPQDNDNLTIWWVGPKNEEGKPNGYGEQWGKYKVGRQEDGVDLVGVRWVDGAEYMADGRIGSAEAEVQRWRGDCI